MDSMRTVKNLYPETLSIAIEAPETNIANVLAEATIGNARGMQRCYRGGKGTFCVANGSATSQQDALQKAGRNAVSVGCAKKKVRSPIKRSVSRATKRTQCDADYERWRERGNS